MPDAPDYAGIMEEAADYLGTEASSIRAQLRAAARRYREEAGKAVAHLCDRHLKMVERLCKARGFIPLEHDEESFPLFAVPVGGEPARDPGAAEKWPATSSKDSEPSRTLLFKACQRAGTDMRDKWLSEGATETIERLALNPAKLAALREAWGPFEDSIKQIRDQAPNLSPLGRRSLTLAAAIEDVLKGEKA